MMFDDLPQKGRYAALLADPPWRFRTWDARTTVETARGGVHYFSMPLNEIRALPVRELAAPDCALFLWATWPCLIDAMVVIDAWGFEYKSCAFCWTKAHAGQLEMFNDEMMGQMGQGYWTRANTEPCLLATRGQPRRLNADVRQAIVEPRREHSRKPDCTRERIERLVAGPYLELFARSRRDGWDAFGDEVGRFKEAAR